MLQEDHPGIILTEESEVAMEIDRIFQDKDQ